MTLKRIVGGVLEQTYRIAMYVHPGAKRELGIHIFCIIGTVIACEF